MPNEKLKPKISGKINEINSLKIFIDYARFNCAVSDCIAEKQTQCFRKEGGGSEDFPVNEMIKKSWMDKIQCLFDLVLS